MNRLSKVFANGLVSLALFGSISSFAVEPTGRTPHQRDSNEWALPTESLRDLVKEKQARKALEEKERQTAKSKCLDGKTADAQQKC